MKSLPILVHLQLMEQKIILATSVSHLKLPKKNQNKMFNNLQIKIITINLKNLILSKNLIRIHGFHNLKRKITLILVPINRHPKLSLYHHLNSRQM